MMKKSLARVKQQLADQLRPGRENALGEELQAADKRVEFLRETLQTLSKALPLPVNGDKRAKKGPDSHIYNTLKNEKCLTNDVDGYGELIQPVFSKYTEMFYNLAEEYSIHELDVDKNVTVPLHKLIDTDISKLKKNLNKHVCDRDNANSRLQSAQNRQSEISNKHHSSHHIVDASKLTSLQEDLEEAGQKVEQASDQLAHDMFTLLSKEPEIANYMLLHIKLRRQYYENALDVLNRLIPDIETLINNSGVRPVFNCPLMDHLRVTKRKIAFPIELCVCAIMEHGICEEGLFRVAGGASKLRRLKLSIDANCLTFPLPSEYKDIHLFAGVLKSYLRELPEPLLTFSLHDEWIHCGRITNEEKRINAIKDVLSKLPKEHFDNLQYLIKFLSELSKNSQNKMSSHNIAIVMSPNLLWGKQEPDLDEIGYTSRAVDTLVTYAELFFPGETQFFESYKHGDIFGTEKNNSSGPIVQHIRNSSNDTSMIILDNEYENSSPKPVMRRKNKPAPEPPKLELQIQSQVETNNQNKIDKPARVITSGTATVNRSTYKNNHESTTDNNEQQLVRRKSLDMDRIIRKEHGQFSKEDISEPTLISNTATTPVKDLNETVFFDNQSVASQTCKITYTPDQRSIQRPTNRPPPVAAPRLSLASDKPEPKMTKSLNDCDLEETVELRKPEGTKPMIPERPPSLRPASFRIQRQPITETTETSTNTSTVLERTVMYNVPDKQFVQFKDRPPPGHDNQIIEKEKFLNCYPTEGEVEEKPVLSVKPQRPPKPADILTKSTERLNLLAKSNERLNHVEIFNENSGKSSHSRTLSEGNIIEKSKKVEVPVMANSVVSCRPPSPRGPSRPPRPQPPPPPPPAAITAKVQRSTESTDL